ncbi:MAG: polysaccharide deacetylase family protein, partial [Candidatus Eisenbacteria sp.]|nr:polysaccharide deacetylase family protein [Candidatus Eisenbacteria bacterium]
MSRKRTERNGFDDLARQAGRSVRNSGLVVRGMAGLHRVGGTILRYHSVSADESWAGDYVQKSLVVAPEVFARQVAFLARRHRIVSVGEMVQQMRSRRGVDPRNVAVTFDDGYEDNYRNAFPILREHGATATFYVTTGTVADARVP